MGGEGMIGAELPGGTSGNRFGALEEPTAECELGIDELDQRSDVAPRDSMASYLLERRNTS
jgi:hypothetical protein